jgi:hypothetical protein
MPNPHWDDLNSLVLVAGHAVYAANDFDDPLSDDSWFLQDFQRGEPPFYLEHIHAGVLKAHADQDSLLIFSGGQTRYKAGPRSEALSYWMIADHFKWFSRTDVRLRATTEEFARDSFENLLFGICRFKECVGRYPKRVTLVGWAFKKQRFDNHRAAIKFPKSRFKFLGVNNPLDIKEAEDGERITVAAFRQDPYGIRDRPDESDPNTDKTVYLAEKRRKRGPFGRQHPYAASCPEQKEMFEHAAQAIKDQAYSFKRVLKAPVFWPVAREGAAQIK